MNPIEDVLRAMKIEHSQYVRVLASAPWGISFRSRHTTRLVMIAAGACRLTSSALPSDRLLSAGEGFIVRAGTEFTLQDEYGREIVDCEDVFASATGTTATFGGDGETTDIVSGRFSFDDVAAEPLFGTLPPLLPLDLDNTWGRLLRATFELLAQEEAEAGIGTGLVSSRLTDVLFVQAIRTFCATEAMGWLAAMRDPNLALAVQAMHTDITHRWTVGALAREAGLSRSAFAVAFKDTTGETPLGHLTSWRIYRAKALLRETLFSLDQVARKVGYESGAALSRAFVRREGIPPGAWRHRYLEGAASR